MIPWYGRSDNHPPPARGLLAREEPPARARGAVATDVRDVVAVTPLQEGGARGLSRTERRGSVKGANAQLFDPATREPHRGAAQPTARDILRTFALRMGLVLLLLVVVFVVLALLQ